MSRDHDIDDNGPRRARDLFDRASAGLDQGMAYRLRRARAQAQQPRTHARAIPLLAPTAIAAVAVLALAVAWWQPPQPVAPVAAPTLSEQQEIDLLLAANEDPELYAWLADAPVAAGNGASP